MPFIYINSRIQVKITKIYVIKKRELNKKAKIQENATRDFYIERMTRAR